MLDSEAYFDINLVATMLQLYKATIQSIVSIINFSLLQLLYNRIVL